MRAGTFGKICFYTPASPGRTGVESAESAVVVCSFPWYRHQYSAVIIGSTPSWQLRKDPARGHTAAFKPPFTPQTGKSAAPVGCAGSGRDAPPRACGMFVRVVAPETNFVVGPLAQAGR